jgi:hypothetical protein
MAQEGNASRSRVRCILPAQVHARTTAYVLKSPHRDSKIDEQKRPCKICVNTVGEI